MEIFIQTPHATPAEEIKKFVQNSISKLLHLYDRIEAAQAFLRLKSRILADDKVCEIRFAAPGNDLFVKKSKAAYLKMRLLKPLIHCTSKLKKCQQDFKIIIKTSYNLCLHSFY